MKKTIGTLALIFTIGFLFMACGGGNKGGGGIEGKWEITEAQGMLADMNKGTVYNFDGKNVSISKGGIETKGTYQLAGDTLKYDFGTMQMKALVKINGDKLNFEIIGSDQKFVMSKK